MQNEQLESGVSSSRRDEDETRGFVADNNFVANSSYDDLIEKARLRLLDVHGKTCKQRGTERPGSFERFFGLFRGFAVILLHHRAPFAVVLTAGEDVMRYLAYVDEAVFFKRSKWLVAYPMARFLKNPLPAVPKGEQPADGFRMTLAFNRWSKPRLAHYSRVNQHLWFSWFQSKRAALTVSDAEGLRAQFDHRSNMLREDPADDVLVGQVIRILDPYLQNINDQLRHTLPKWSHYREHQASLSSAFGSTRKAGGQQGLLARSVGIDPNSTSDVLHTVQMVGIRELGPDDFIEGSHSRIQTIVTQVDDLLHWRNTTHLVAVLDSYDAFDHLPLQAEIALVFEPLKIRVISKGPAAVYYSSVELQKELHGILRNWPCFRAIGRPISPTDIFAVCDPHSVRPLFDVAAKQYFSADYKTSTDMLSSNYALSIVDRVCAGLPDRNIYMSALLPHYIHYPITEISQSEYPAYLRSVEQAWKDECAIEVASGGVAMTYEQYVAAFCLYLRERFPKSSRNIKPGRPGVLKTDGDTLSVVVPPVQQRNGQLMGSIMSFNILCIANLGGYLTATLAYLRTEQSDQLLNDLELTERLRYLLCGKITRSERKSLDSAREHVLINGDDLLAHTTPFFAKIFFVVSAWLGLELSVGKTYIHPRYANINSTCFDVGQSVKQINYLNTGLYFGNNKVMSTRDTDSTEVVLEDLAPHVAVIDRVVDGSLPGLQGELLGNYIHHHRDVLASECRGRNLFVAQSLGGFGRQRPPGFRFHVTPSQKQEALRLLNSGHFLNAQQPSFPRRRAADRVRVIRPWFDPRKPTTGITKVRKSKTSGIEFDILGVDPEVEIIDTVYFKHLDGGFQF